MKVTSPVGEYEYRVNRVRMGRGGRIVIDGNLGVWDTTMEIDPGDWLRLGRRLAKPAAAIAAAALVLTVARR
jgi:hypothetical protein